MHKHAARGSDYYFCCWSKYFFISFLYINLLANVRRRFFSRGKALNNFGPELITECLNKVVLNTGQVKFRLLLRVWISLSTNLNILFWWWLLYINSSVKNLCIKENFKIFASFTSLVTESNFFRKNMLRRILFWTIVNF